MFSTLKIILKNTSQKRRFQLGILIFLTLFSSLLEVFSMGAIFPFISVFLDPSLLFANDYFKPIVDCPKLFEFRLQVYNRWGELIFETTDVSKSWDGSFQNTRSQDGVYFWTSNWTGILNGISQVQSSKGVVHLMR